MVGLRNPFLPIGIVLVVLGFGNWYTGLSKSVEYERLLSAGTLPAPIEDFDEFRELNADTNATLLRTLQRGSDESTIIYAKLDFYRVVQSGGRMLVLLGFFSAAAGMIHSWYRQRIADRGMASKRSA